MRFEVKNLKELRESVHSMDDGDRLSLNLSVNMEHPSLTDMKIAVRVTERGIFVHELKLEFPDNTPVFLNTG